MLSIAERIAVCEGLPIRFIHSPIEDGLPVLPSAFDLVVCALTLCHVPDLRGAIREFHRAIAPGGHLLITDVHPDFVAAGMPTQFVEGGTTYHLPNEPHTQDDYPQAIEDVGLHLSTVLRIPCREVPGEFENEFMRENFSDVNSPWLRWRRGSRTVQEPRHRWSSSPHDQQVSQFGKRRQWRHQAVTICPPPHTVDTAVFEMWLGSLSMHQGLAIPVV